MASTCSVGNRALEEYDDYTNVTLQQRFTLALSFRWPKFLSAADIIMFLPTNNGRLAIDCTLFLRRKFDEPIFLGYSNFFAVDDKWRYVKFIAFISLSLISDLAITDDREFSATRKALVIRTSKESTVSELV